MIRNTFLNVQKTRPITKAVEAIQQHMSKFCYKEVASPIPDWSRRESNLGPTWMRRRNETNLTIELLEYTIVHFFSSGPTIDGIHGENFNDWQRCWGASEVSLCLSPEIHSKVQWQPVRARARWKKINYSKWNTCRVVLVEGNLWLTLFVRY